MVHATGGLAEGLGTRLMLILICNTQWSYTFPLAHSLCMKIAGASVKPWTFHSNVEDREWFALYRERTHMQSQRYTQALGQYYNIHSCTGGNQCGGRPWGVQKVAWMGEKKKKKIKAFVHSKLLLLRGICHSIAVSIGGIGIAKSIQISAVVFPV